MPPVSSHPESLEALRGRYARALEHVFDVPAIRDRGGIRPGEVAANVFDFEDGLRLIVSRERMPEGHVVRHVSASFAEHGRMADEFRLLAVTTPREKLFKMWLADIPGRFAELSGDERTLRYAGFSGKVPHFFIEE
jgi:hypothetical protein